MPHASAPSAANTVISEIATTALPRRNDDWKARKPPKVPTTANTVQTDAIAAKPCACQSVETALIAASATAYEHPAAIACAAGPPVTPAAAAIPSMTSD